jgi:hypothetical protein
MNATHTLKREIVWAGRTFPAGTAVDANVDEPRSGGYFFVKTELNDRAWFLSTTNDNLDPIEPDDKTTATESHTMLQLIDALASDAIHTAVTFARERHDARQVRDATRAEIVRRLDLVENYGGTEASNIKAILRTGRPLDGYHPSDRGPLKSCPACRSKDPAVRLNPGGFVCDDPSRFHQQVSCGKGWVAEIAPCPDCGLSAAHHPHTAIES